MGNQEHVVLDGGVIILGGVGNIKEITRKRGKVHFTKEKF